MKLETGSVLWCMNLWRGMREKGMWGFPDAGFLFQKKDGVLALVGKMPWQDGMPGTADEWAAHQKCEFDKTVAHFGAFGVVVRDDTNAPPAGPPKSK